MNSNKVSRLTIVDKQYKIRQFLNSNTQRDRKSAQNDKLVQIVYPKQDKAA